jgi:dTDP-4-amino-4,6-dideoxygalactose transaminase
VIGQLAAKHDLWVIEDAAQALGATYNGRPLGTVGDFGAFSFHETKNVISGEGGSLHVNDPDLVGVAEIVREKGTNRSSFFRGEVDKYGWVSLGSSFLPSEVTAAVLLAQLEAMDEIQAKRLARWNQYEDRLDPLAASGRIGRACLPNYASNIAHLYFITLASLAERTALVDWLKERGIAAAFHYQSLHASRFYAEWHDGRPLRHADRFTDTLLRLPLFGDLTFDEVDQVCDAIYDFFAQH